MTTMARVPGLRKVLDWVVTIGVALVFVLVFEAEVAKPYRIPSSSMEPTLHCAKPGAWCEGRFNDRVIANRLAYRFTNPQRGQIVVFHAPARRMRDRRHVRQAADRPARRHGVGDETATSRSTASRCTSRTSTRSCATRSTQHVAACRTGRYFFMGDDRVHSCDSRMWGTVPRSSLIGPVLFTYWPPTSWF